MSVEEMSKAAQLGGHETLAGVEVVVCHETNTTGEKYVREMLYLKEK